MATNLACAASLATSGRAVLLDLDLYSGDVSVHLDLVEGPTIVEMLPELSELRQDSLDKYAAKHGPSNLNVLCSPRRPELSELVNPGHVKTILSLAEKRWGLLYVDTPPDITSEILGECVEAASKIMLVVTQDIPTLRQTKIALDILRRLGIKEDRVEVVLNRANKESPVPESKVREYLECDLAGSVPEDRKTAERSLFEGKPVVLFNRTEISDALWHLVTYICPGLKKPMGSKKPLRRRRKFIW